MVSATDVAEAAASAVTGAVGEHPRGVLASRRRLFGPLLDMTVKQGSTPLVVTGLFQGCVRDLWMWIRTQMCQGMGDRRVPLWCSLDRSLVCRSSRPRLDLLTPPTLPLHFCSYLAYNLARKALAVAAPGLQQEPNEGGLRLSKTDLGLVSSSFTAMYGASKFAGSVITGGHEDNSVVVCCGNGRQTPPLDDHIVVQKQCLLYGQSRETARNLYYHKLTHTHFTHTAKTHADHVSCRALFSLGLVLTGVLCFVFSLSNDLPRLCLLWSVHGIVQVAMDCDSQQLACEPIDRWDTATEADPSPSLTHTYQGAGWPSLAKMCVERVPPQAQGRVWALLSAAGNAGA